VLLAGSRFQYQLDALAARLAPKVEAGGGEALVESVEIGSLAELLVTLACAVRGDPPIARQVAVPEPNTPGLGWGQATTP